MTAPHAAAPPRSVAAPGPSSAPAYRPEIDGLRAVAVLPVILFHAGLGPFSGGFVGVDVFFVISGYLITGILIRQIEAGRFSLLDFYSRRARRILPALALVVAVSTPVAWFLMLPLDFKDYAQSVAAVGLFASNVLFWWESGYFAAAAEEKPLLHTWSLAVEEQYYVVFPLLMAWTWGVRRRAVWLLGLLTLGSLALSEWMWRSYPDANFYLIPTRAWELLAGSLCAVWQARFGQGRHQGLSALGLAMVLAAILLFDGTTPFPSLYALLPVAGTAMVILWATPATLAGALLSWRGAVGIGLISYSAYLWHQPLFAFARIATPGAPSLALMAALAALALALAWASWRFVEQPFRRPGTWPKGRVVAAAAAVSVGFLALGTTLATTDWQRRDFVARLDAERAGLLARMEAEETRAWRAFDDGACRFGVVDAADETANDPDHGMTLGPALDARMADCAERHGGAVAVFGDSHAMNAVNALAAGSGVPFLVHMGQGPCRPHQPDAPCAGSPLMRFLDAHGERIARAVYVQAGFWLLRDEAGRARARAFFHDDTVPALFVHDARVERVLDFLAGLDRRLDVLWLGPRMEPHVPLDGLLGFRCAEAPEAVAIPPQQRAAFTGLDATLAARAAARGVAYVSTQAAVGFDAARDVLDCDGLYWRDGDHWSAAGEARFGARLAPGVLAARLPGS